MKKMLFVRIGGLSSVNYKKGHKSLDFANHPPKKKGVYAFIFPYIECFFYSWKCINHETGMLDKKMLKTQGYRKFEYEGWLWCHFLDAVGDLKEREVIGDWVKVHTSELPNIIRKVNHQDCKQLINSNFACPDYFLGKKFPTNAYKRGQGGYMSLDHFEVFIEKV